MKILVLHLPALLSSNNSLLQYYHSKYLRFTSYIKINPISDIFSFALKDLMHLQEVCVFLIVKLVRRHFI